MTKPFLRHFIVISCSMVVMFSLRSSARITSFLIARKPFWLSVRCCFQRQLMPMRMMSLPTIRIKFSISPCNHRSRPCHGTVVDRLFPSLSPDQGGHVRDRGTIPSMKRRRGFRCDAPTNAPPFLFCCLWDARAAACRNSAVRSENAVNPSTSSQKDQRPESFTCYLLCSLEAHGTPTPQGDLSACGWLTGHTVPSSCGYVSLDIFVYLQVWGGLNTEPCGRSDSSG